MSELISVLSLSVNNNNTNVSTEQERVFSLHYTA
jgi:hypothetical protein